jgi:FkbM family methyltransferase
MSSLKIKEEQDDPILDQILNDKFDEHKSLEFWTFMALSAKPRALFLDIGAFSGIFSLVATAANSNLKVIAFEPSAVTFGRLAQNIRINGMDLRVIPVNFAASNVSSLITFPHRYGIFNLCPGECIDQSQIDHTQTASAIKVDQLLSPIDSLPCYLNSKGIPLHPFSVIDGIKIDVERHEPQVLEGCRAVIEKFRPTFICEALGVDEEVCLIDFFDAYKYAHLKVEGERNMIFIAQEKYISQITGYNAWVKNKNFKLTGSVVSSFPVC